MAGPDSPKDLRLLAFEHAIQPQSPRWNPAVDWNGDGVDEVAYFKSRTTLSIEGVEPGEWPIVRQLHVRSGWEFGHTCGFCFLPDLNQDGVREIAVSRMRGDSIAVDVFGLGRDFSLGPIKAWDARPDSIRDYWVAPIGCIDSPNGSLLVIERGAGHDRYSRDSRSLAAYSLETGERRWTFLTASNLLWRKMANLSPQAGEEILFATSSPENQVFEPPLDDLHVWLGLVGSDGRLLWHRSIGITSRTNAWVEIIGSEDGNELILACSRRNGVAPTGPDGTAAGDTLWSVSAATGELRDHYVFPGTVQGFAMVDSTTWVLQTTRGEWIRGRVQAGGKLVEEGRTRLDPAIRMLTVVDCDGEGNREVVAGERKPDGVFVIHTMSPHFRQKRSQATYLRPHVAWAGSYGGSLREPCLLLATDSTMVVLTRTDALGTLVLPAPPSEGGANAGLWAALLGVTVMLGGAALLLLRRRRAVAASALGLDASQIRMLWVNLFRMSDKIRHGQLACVHVLEAMISLLESVPIRELRANPALTERIAGRARDYREHASPEIHQLLDACRCLEFEDALTATLDRHRKSIDRLVAHILDHDDWLQGQDDLFQSSRGELRLLTSGLKELRLAILRSLSRPLGEEVAAAMRSAREEADRAGAEIRCATAPEQMPKVIAYAGDVPFYVENLLGNALRAVRDREDRSITIECRSEERYAKLIVRDTGCGMTEAQVSSLFQRGTQRRVDGGSGLGLTRSMIEEFDGGIRVLESIPGKGTAFELSLRLGTAGAAESVQKPFRGGQDSAGARQMREKAGQAGS